MAMLCKKKIQIKNQNTEKCLHQKAESYKAQLKFLDSLNIAWYCNYNYIHGWKLKTGNLYIMNFLRVVIIFLVMLVCPSFWIVPLPKMLEINPWVEIERQRLLAFNVRDREKGQRLLVNCFSLNSKSIKPPKVEPFVICLSTLSRMMDFTGEATKYYKEQIWIHV